MTLLPILQGLLVACLFGQGTCLGSSGKRIKLDRYSYYGDPQYSDYEQEQLYNKTHALMRRENYGHYTKGKGNEFFIVDYKNKENSVSSNYKQASSLDYSYPTSELDTSVVGASISEDFGEYAAETGYGGGGGGGGGGYGGGGGGYGGGATKCNSALGLMGVLGLAAYLQNVLRQMTSTAAPPPRREKRGIDDMSFEPKSLVGETDPNRVIQLILPLMTAAAHARDGLVPISCTYLPICLSNRKLVKELGLTGSYIGTMIGVEVAKFLQPVIGEGESMKMSMAAGKAGRQGRNCIKLYTDCEKLRRLPSYIVPQM